MSLTIGSWIFTAIDFIFSWGGITITQGEWDSFIKVGVGIISLLGIWYGRYRKGDIKWWGGRKTTPAV